MYLLRKFILKINVKRHILGFFFNLLPVPVTSASWNQVSCNQSCEYSIIQWECTSVLGPDTQSVPVEL